ncbi:KpsF/GutQ family sugar-phosphate isomerase [Panacibacter sp. DH6]|uniref:KpsF/GutQ family sugar-phosphate isomerase n=1 Tax=Panacibacter microcysteis TaxID=2793269 RepID=A0A931GYB8_9BACT|nr:KpsF/GutQ family sugar-phosphate isomerase [Panacibacter microcysteis]MBG9375177.1 KpsF/GutQ family sugar-phosphate isomerase [Panacibacter microcysteis]
MNKEIKDIALRTIDIETKSLSGLKSFIDDTFTKVVELIHASKGRLVVTGIGKSAIVGHKIVATLNSTGTPALFMHAADAIHGDLGMIQQDDVVIVISKSGESPEIKVLVPLIKNFGNTLIGMIGSKQSFLAKEADHILNTSVEQEACPNNLAPTSSTTAQMVMGDALAICLMHLNEFSGKDFAKYHPGGNLGKRLYLKVDDLYKQNEKPFVYGHATLKDVIISISKGRLGATAVVDNNHALLAVVTDGDVRRMLETTSDVKNLLVTDIYNKHPKTVMEGVLAIEALELLKQYDISQLIVTSKDNIYLGILHLHDLIREGII